MSLSGLTDEQKGKLAGAFALAAIFLAAVAVAIYQSVQPGPEPPPTDSINVVGKKWTCNTHVDLASVTVTIRPEDPIADGAQLADGCSGYIGTLDVENHHGDGVKFGFARDLTIGNLIVHCFGKSDGKHQDGVQVQSAVDIKVEHGYVGCYSANNSQVLIHTGSNENQIPTNVVFNDLTVDPQGIQNPDGSPPGTYGPGGSYGVSNGASDNSGFTHLHFISRSNNHDLWQGDGTTNPLWQCDDVAAGTRANWDTADSGCAPPTP